LMAAMDWISERAAALPGAYFNIRAPSLLEFAVYYLALGACWSGWVFAPSRRKWAAVGAAGLLAAWAIHWAGDRDTIRLIVPPLGGGGLIFDAPGRADDLLIDCGSRSAAEFVVRPILRAQGVNKLPQVLLTHGDVNHVGGWDHLRTNFQVSRVFTGAAHFRSPVYRQIIAELEKAPDRSKQLRRGDQLGRWTVLHPGADDQFSLADDNTIVLRGEFHGVRILLLSDLGRLGQMKLLERAPDLRADLVITGRPTQGEPLISELIEAAQPHWIIVANANSPASESVGRKLKERLARTRVPIVYTSEVGAVTVILQPGRRQFRAPNGQVFADGSTPPPLNYE